MSKTQVRNIASPREERLGGQAFPLMSVSISRGVIDRRELTDDPPRADDLTNYRVCRPGDLVINRMSAYQGALGLARVVGAVSPDYLVLKIRDESEPRFLDYLFRSHAFVSEMTSLVRGVGSAALGTARTPRINWADLQRIEITSLPRNEQRQIAEYLDRETGKIDTLITKQEQLVATLIERRDAIWFDSLDGLVKENGELSLRRAIRSIVDGPFGSSLTSAHYVEAGARVIRLGNIGVNEFKGADEAYIPLEYAAHLSAHAVLPDDVLVAGLGDEKMPLGRAAVAPADLGPAIVKADCYRIRPAKGVSPAYLAWALSSPQLREQFRILSRGSTRQRLNTAVVREARIPIPSTEIQADVMERFDMSASKIDELMRRAELVVGTLRERRQALISAAVTGKIDVRGQ